MPLATPPTTEVPGQSTVWVGSLPGPAPLAYHFDGSQGAQGVCPPAAGPGVPAWVFTLFEHKLLTLAIGLLVAHPAARQKKGPVRLLPGILRPAGPRHATQLHWSHLNPNTEELSTR